MNDAPGLAVVWTGRELIVPDMVVCVTSADDQTTLVTQGGLRLGP